jgi:hypothetical protein
MSDQNDSAFHDSESEDDGDVADVFDLYQACNGETIEGVLNVAKLDKLSAEEREVLDVPRLRELASHVVSGCSHCASIVDTLNRARLELRMMIEETRTGQTEPVAAKYAD